MKQNAVKGLIAVSRRRARNGLELPHGFVGSLMAMLRSPGGCIAFVPISPDVMKFPFDAWFGFGNASY